jgi:hypothetical protein
MIVWGVRRRRRVGRGCILAVWSVWCVMCGWGVASWMLVRRGTTNRFLFVLCWSTTGGFHRVEGAFIFGCLTVDGWLGKLAEVDAAGNVTSTGLNLSRRLSSLTISKLAAKFGIVNSWGRFEWQAPGSSYNHGFY